jgi:catechol 2,3-dioxygenase-like lactoylglutathione lyase family enzyme
MNPEPPSRIHHVALRVADPERSLGFYGGVLGLTEARRFDEQGRVRSIWMSLGDAVLMLEREIKGSGGAAHKGSRGAGPEVSTAPSGSGHVLVLAVSDLAAWESRLAAAGVAIADRTAATLYVIDPDGHRVGLSVYPLGA